ncbi:MAG: aldo/keto reductase [Saprospiraceae bacterium]|nr:aldo/keto reductase [Saprospiraceae bacterium]
MQRRTCPNTGLSLPILGLGCWSFGGGDYWGPRELKDEEAIVKTALEHGINYLDTAEIYNSGRSEESLGKIMRNIPRDQVLIGSKISPANCQPAILVEHCEASLRRLQTDYIDLYMVHWPVHPAAIKSFTKDPERIANPPRIEEVYQTLLELQQAGKIRHIGISNFAVSRMAELPALDKIAINQLAYNLISRSIELEVLPYCEKHGVGTMGYMGLMQGILSGRWASFDEIPMLRRRTRHFDSRKVPNSRTGEPGFEAETSSVLQELRAISEETGYSMADLALKWVCANPNLTCNLVGASSPAQLAKNGEAVKKELEAPLLHRLNEASVTLRDKMGNHIDLFESTENDRTV